MEQEGELCWTFTGNQTPLKFLSYFDKSATLLFNIDKEGLICRAAWLEPFMEGAFLGLYLRSDVRKSKQSWIFVQNVYEVAFKAYKTLVGIVSELRPDKDKIIWEHSKLGYSAPIIFPYLFGGDSALVLYITQDMWNAGHKRRHENGKWRRKGIIPRVKSDT